MQSVWWQTPGEPITRLLVLALVLGDVTENGSEGEMQEAASLCLSFADRTVRERLDRESKHGYNDQAARIES